MFIQYIYIYIWGVAAGAGRATRGWNNWLRWVRLDMGLGVGPAATWDWVWEMRLLCSMSYNVSLDGKT